MSTGISISSINRIKELAEEKKYAEAGAYPVKVDEAELNKMGVGIIKADLITQTDAIHHDPQKLCDSVMRIVYGLRR